MCCESLTYVVVQGGKDAKSALFFAEAFFAKKPLIIALFCGK